MHSHRTLAFVLVAAALVALPAASAQATIVVGCTGTPATDGSNLLSAYSGASAPEVVQPSPCDYDLGTSTLQMQNGVDLVGLSRNTTIIRSQNNTAGQGTITVPSGADVELRNVTIQNDTDDCVGIDNSSSSFVAEDVVVEATCEETATAIFTDGQMRGFDLVLRADVDGEEVATAVAVALEDDGSDSVFSDTLMVAGGIACTDAVGALLDNSDATFDEVSIFVSCGGNPLTAGRDAIGIEVIGGGSGSHPLITNTKIVATTINSDAAGIETSGGSNVVRVTDTRIDVDGDDNGYGILKNGSLSVVLSNVSALASGASSNVGLQVNAGLATVDRSTLLGDTGGAAFNVASGATGRFGVSKLIGSRGTTGTTTCVGNYDGSYAAITSTTC